MSTDEQAELARVVMEVLDEWSLEPEQRAALLGLPEGTRKRILDRYRKGTPFSEDRDTQQRLSHVLNIHRILATVLPHNPAMAAHWITAPNPYFNDLTPLEVMLNGGLDGLERIVRHLNWSGGWY